MDEEEPMDISLETSYSDSFHSNNLNATIASSSPITKERKQILSHQNALRLRHQMENINVTPPKGKGQGHSPSRGQGHIATPIRKLHKSGRYGKPETDYNRNLQDDENSPPSKKGRFEKGKGSKEKPGIFQSLKGKLMLWILLVLVFILVRFVIFNRNCSHNMDISKLDSDLGQLVFGQHIARKEVISVLDAYLKDSASRNHTDVKPLVLSFHGWTGVGKNLITNIILKSLSKKRVKTFLVPLHFAHNSQNDVYKNEIPYWIKSNISTCITNVVIFDEMDKAPSGVIDGLHDVLKQLKLMHIDVTWIIFLLLSNSRGGAINSHLFDQISAGRLREHLTSEEFMPILLQNSEKEWYSKLHKDSLVDKFVPFLPLTLEHVRQCIERDILSKGKKPDAGLVQRVLEEMNYFSPQGQAEQYSYTGCKRVADKVDLHITYD